MEVNERFETFDIDWSFEGIEEPLSVHVVEADGATVLFGGGDDSIADELVELAREHEVDVVVVEHADPDHYTGVPALREALDVEVAVPAGDADTLREAGVEVDHLLEPGETYWGIRTVSAPGHTPDNMAYLYGEVCVAGDTVCGSDSVFAADDDWSGPLGVLMPGLSHDDAQARASVATLLEFGYEVVLLTHGSSVLEDGLEAVETVVEDLS